MLFPKNTQKEQQDQIRIETELLKEKLDKFLKDNDAILHSVLNYGVSSITTQTVIMPRKVIEGMKRQDKEEKKKKSRFAI